MRLGTLGLNLCNPAMGGFNPANEPSLIMWLAGDNPDNETYTLDVDFAPGDVNTSTNVITLTLPSSEFTFGQPYDSMKCRFTSTGTLPAPFQADTDYLIMDNGDSTASFYPILSDADHTLLDGYADGESIKPGQAYATQSNKINITSQGSGTHTITTEPILTKLADKSGNAFDFHEIANRASSFRLMTDPNGKKYVEVPGSTGRSNKNDDSYGKQMVDQMDNATMGALWNGKRYMYMVSAARLKFNTNLSTLRAFITPDQVVSGTGVFTANSHTFTTGDPVQYGVLSDGGAFPTPTVAFAGTIYVRAVTASTFSLHPTALDATNGTSAYTFSNTGTGVFYVTDNRKVQNEANNRQFFFDVCSSQNGHDFAPSTYVYRATLTNSSFLTSSNNGRLNQVGTQDALGRNWTTLRVNVFVPDGATAPIANDTATELESGDYWITAEGTSSVRLHRTEEAATAAYGIPVSSLSDSQVIKFDATGMVGNMQLHVMDKAQFRPFNDSFATPDDFELFTNGEMAVWTHIQDYDDVSGFSVYTIGKNAVGNLLDGFLSTDSGANLTGTVQSNTNHSNADEPHVPGYRDEYEVFIGVSDTDPTAIVENLTNWLKAKYNIQPWNITQDIDNRRYYVPNMSAATTDSGNVTSIPDYDGGSVALAPRSGSAAIPYNASDAGFNNKATVTNPGGANDGLDSAIGDFTTDEASFAGVFKMDSLDLSMFFELGQNASGNKGPQFLFSNSDNKYYFRVPTVSETLPGPSWIVPDGTFIDEPFVFVGRYSAAKGKIEAFINGKRFGESYTLTGTKTLKNVLNRLHVSNYGWGSAELDGEVGMFLATDDWLSTEEVQKVTDELYGNFIGTKPNTYVVIGDSQSAGYLVTGDGWVDSLRTDVASTHRVVNEAISGMRMDYNADTTLDILYQHATKNAYSRWAIGTDDVAIIWAGTNDISDSTSAATVAGYIETLANSLKATGFEKVYVVGPVDRTGLSAEMFELDDYLSAVSSPPWDGYVDLINQVEFDDYTDTTYYNADGVHLKDAGQAKVWDYIETIIDGGTLPGGGTGGGAGLPKIWVASDGAKTITSGNVETWPNDGTLGGSFTQITSTRRPLHESAILNSKDGAYFDGTDDRLNGTSDMYSILNNKPGFTIIAVCDAVASNDTIFSIRNRVSFGWTMSASQPVLKASIKRANADANAVNTDTNTVFTAGSPYIVGIRVDYGQGAGAGYFYNQKTQLTAISLASLASSPGNSEAVNTGFVDLGRDTVGTAYFDGSLFELRMFDSMLSVPSYDAVVDELKTKFGL